MQCDIQLNQWYITGDATDTTSSSTNDNSFYDKDGYIVYGSCSNLGNGDYEAVQRWRCSRINSDHDAWYPDIKLGLRYVATEWYGAVGCNEGYSLDIVQDACTEGSLCTVQYDLNLISPYHGYELDGRVYGIWQLDGARGHCKLYEPCMPYCSPGSGECPSAEDDAIAHRLCESCRHHTGKWIRSTKMQHQCSP